MRLFCTRPSCPIILNFHILSLCVCLASSARIPSPPYGLVKVDGGLTQRADRVLEEHSSETHSSDISPSDDDYEMSDASSEADPIINYQEYVQNGQTVARYLQATDKQIKDDLVAGEKMRPDEPLASSFTEVGQLYRNGWKYEDDTNILLQDFDIVAAVRPALRSLEISDKALPEGKNEHTAFRHLLPWFHNGKAMKPVGTGAAFYYVTNPAQACLIITTSHSTDYAIKKDPEAYQGIVSPPLKHMSDITFLAWKRACSVHRTNLKHLRHLFISVIATKTTQQVVKRIFDNHDNKLENSWIDLPLWEHRLTLEPKSEEWHALLGTIQLKGIMWMLVQHRAELGEKMIKTVSIFKDTVTGVDRSFPVRGRGPTLYIELEGIAPPESGLVQRADSESSSEVHISDLSPSDVVMSDASSEEPPIDYEHYVQRGTTMLRYMRASDTELTTALRADGYLQPGEQLASRFTDVNDLLNNGYSGEDETAKLADPVQFEDAVAFKPALKALGLSDEARPQGKNEIMYYTHTLPWTLNGKEMQPAGPLAQFRFVTNPQEGCLIFQLAYSTDYAIHRHALDLHHGIASPPLHHKSDIAFLEWKRVCAKYNTNPKLIKHVFLSVIKTGTTQQAILRVFENLNRQLNSWLDVPLWEHRLIIQPNSNEGKALLNTVQIKGVIFMLLQHRPQLGKKAIKSISIFRDTLTGTHDDYDPRTRVPSIYLELEDVLRRSERLASGGT